MRVSVLLGVVASLFVSTAVIGATYQCCTDGTWETFGPLPTLSPDGTYSRPITFGVITLIPQTFVLDFHPYSGPNLGPGVHAPGADLTGAILRQAALSDANLSDANFQFADFWEADLSGADLSGASLGAYFGGANLHNANLSGANLNSAQYLRSTAGSPFYSPSTVFANDCAGLPRCSPPFDPVAAGWTLIPEPGTATLMGLGLLGLARAQSHRSRGHRL